LVVAALVYVPQAHALFGTEALGPTELAAVVGFAVLPSVLVEAWKARRRKGRTEESE
jgi:hypothetical protein